MKRTTIYLDSEMELLLKTESMRRGEPMSDLIREAVRSYLGGRELKAPPGGGAFDSGKTTTAARAEQVLRQSGFGEG